MSPLQFPGRKIVTPIFWPFEMSPRLFVENQFVTSHFSYFLKKKRKAACKCSVVQLYT